MKETKIEKAQRFHREGKVTKGDCFLVEGDNDTYLVAYSPQENQIICTCPTQDVTCSHQLAVALQIESE